MAELLTAAAVLNSFLYFAARVQELGENYYKGSAEWRDLPVKVARLRTQGEIWLGAFADYGISDEALIDTLQDAISLLRAEEAKLSKRQQSEGTVYGLFTGCLAKAHVLAFPSEIALRIQRVEDAFLDIKYVLSLKEGAKSAVERESLNTSYALTFKRDERYVPLEDTERQIYSAVETSPGRIVVLLHGGPGRGKSSLARHVALHYKNAEKEASSQVTNRTLFEQVVFLECGAEADVSIQKQQLIQQLGLNSISSAENQHAASSISQLLIGALKSRRILIMFDDVWDVMFLQHMIDVCGDNVKCLVTSQNGELCSRLNCSSAEKITIQIQAISQEVGRKILAAHVRFQNQCIPNQQILAIVDKMIADTEGNPLALASVISAIQDNKKHSVEIWEEAYSDLQELLMTEDIACLFGQRYPRSFWSATKLSIRSLSKEAQALLTLIHLCKGPSVPEEVIRFLLGKTDLLTGKGVTFRSLTNHLEGRELLKINETLIGNYSEKSWSTHSLQRLFMDEDAEMRELKGKIFHSLSGFANKKENGKHTVAYESSAEPLQDGDAIVTRVLAALYFEEQFARKAGSELNIQEDNLKVQRRQTLEPITRLVGKPLSLRWTPDEQTAAKQVFVNFFCKCELDDENISLLLNMSSYPLAQFAAVNAILGIGLIRETPSLKKGSKLLAGLLPCLYNSDAPSLQVRAAHALSGLIWRRESNRIQIVNEEGALAGLVKCLSNHNDPDLQNEAASVLSGLAWGPQSVKDRIMREDGALHALVTSLSKDGNPGLQQVAAAALAALATGQESTKLQILNQDGALGGLVRSLSMDYNPHLQGEAAWALRNLAGGPEAAKQRILKEKGSLQGLVNALSKDQNLDLQVEAVFAMRALAEGSVSTKLQIFNHDGVLLGLVRKLKESNLSLEKGVTDALKLLAVGPEVAWRRLPNEGRALQVLVKYLSSDSNPVLQCKAALALADLAFRGRSTILQILDQEGALVGLLRCLSKDEHPNLQSEAARALANLASGPQSAKVKILKEEGLIEGLVDAASKHENGDLQENASRALGNLGRGG